MNIEDYTQEELDDPVIVIKSILKDDSADGSNTI
jgi:hypothetical protein